MAIPIGGIILWTGLVGAIPAGYHLCDGTAGTPDLRNYMVPCAGADVATPGIKYLVGDIGGSATFDFGNHSHGLGTVALANESAHRHATGVSTDAASATTPGIASLTGSHVYPGGNHTHDITDPVQTGAEHQHTHSLSGTYASVDPAAIDQLPEWIGVYFIQRIA